jgi:hypothetical protein
MMTFNELDWLIAESQEYLDKHIPGSRIRYRIETDCIEVKFPIGPIRRINAPSQLAAVREFMALCQHYFKTCTFHNMNPFACPDSWDTTHPLRK